MTINDYPRVSRARLSAQSAHAAAGRRGHRGRLRRGARGGGRAHQAQDQLREETQEKGADLGLRAGHGVRRSDGGAGERDAAAGASCVPPGFMPSPTRSTPRPRSISKPAPFTAACSRRKTSRCLYMEDVGVTTRSTRSPARCSRHGVPAHDKIFYTTGRLTSEMVIKTVRMGIPILISRSGFTAWGVELARKANLTLVGRARGKRFVALAGEDASCSIRTSPSRGGKRQAPAQGRGADD